MYLGLNLTFLLNLLNCYVRLKTKGGNDMALNIELDLLSEEQLVGENKLKIFDQIGMQISPTDFAIILGAYVSDYFSTKEGKKSGWYWIKPINSDTFVTDWGETVCAFGFGCGIDDQGILDRYYNEGRTGCIRPIVQYSKIKDICQNKRIGKHGELIVDCGMYPKMVVDATTKKYINDMTYKGWTENIDFVTTDSVETNKWAIDFKKREQNIFQNQRTNELFTLATNSNFNTFVLSNGDRYSGYNRILLDYSMIEWGVDLDSDIAVVKDGIVSGLYFTRKADYQWDFKNTDMYQYMNTYLVRDMFSIYLKKLYESDQSGIDHHLITEEISRLESLVCLPNQSQKNDISHQKILRRLIDKITRN